MSGLTALDELLRVMSPELLDGEFVFCSFANAAYGEHVNLNPIVSMVEKEGLTLVVPRQNADEAQLSYDSIFRCISLRVHSSLDAVGLTAAFAGKLADHGISANVIAGFYHDHMFVKKEEAQLAMIALEEFAQ